MGEDLKRSAGHLPFCQQERIFWNGCCTLWYHDVCYVLSGIPVLHSTIIYYVASYVACFKLKYHKKIPPGSVVIQLKLS